MESEGAGGGRTTGLHGRIGDIVADVERQLGLQAAPLECVGGDNRTLTYRYLQPVDWALDEDPPAIQLLQLQAQRVLLGLIDTLRLYNLAATVLIVGEQRFGPGPVERLRLSWGVEFTVPL